MSEEPHKNQATPWIIGGVVVLIVLLGCCVVATLLGAIGYIILPARTVSITQISSGPLIIGTSTPTPVFVVPLDTATPFAPDVTEAPVYTPTAIAPAEPPDEAPEGAETGTVVKIVDGDTIDVNIGGQVFRVRYIGINTPETNQTCGSEATAANKALVNGKTVSLVKDISETDRYDRLLRYVYVGETFVNAQLVQDGWAEAVAYPPDTKYADLFRKLQDEAREQNVGCWPSGVWGEMPPVQPPTLGGAGGAVCDCSGNLYNCGAFKTHAEAQACFEYCISTVGKDAHDLDGDGDGRACESLP